MTRLVTVSNRTPSADRAEGSGGLVVALSATMRTRGGLWFGWSGAVGAASSDATLWRHDGGFEVATLNLSTEEHAGFYLRYSNAVLWPLCHGLASAAELASADDACYQRVNQRYAEALVPMLRADDVLWVHDFHLLPLGQWLRAAGVQERMGFFLHVPFPELKALQTLASGAELVRSMFSYDLVGFQTARDLDRFVTAARWAFGQAHLHPDGVLIAGALAIRVGVFPVGVDIAAVAAEAEASQHSPRVVQANVLRRERTLLMAADRLIASKGIEQRLQAYGIALTEPWPVARPPLLLQVAVPPEQATSADAKCARAVERWVERLHASPASGDGPCLHYVRERIAHAELMGLLRAAHVGLVTPLCDGMNLVAKEFVAAQDAADPAMLVLSSDAGAARELDAALQVDPHDEAAVAAAIRRAANATLTERRERHQAMMAALRRHDLAAWHSDFLAVLGQTRPITPASATVQGVSQSIHTPASPATTSPIGTNPAPARASTQAGLTAASSPPDV